MNKYDRNSISIQLYFFPFAAQLNSVRPFEASCTPERRTRRSVFESTSSTSVLPASAVYYATNGNGLYRDQN